MVSPTTILLSISAIALAKAAPSPGLLYEPIVYATGPEIGPIVTPNSAVEINAANEALLPRDQIKSKDFYDNPVVAAALARDSWFTNKEMQVVSREAEKIPRAQIYKIVKNAGFLDRN